VSEKIVPLLIKLLARFLLEVELIKLFLIEMKNEVCVIFLFLTDDSLYINFFFTVAMLSFVMVT